MQSCIKTMFESQLSSSLGILHKDHCAHRGNPFIFEAIHTLSVVILLLPQSSALMMSMFFS